MAMRKKFSQEFKHEAVQVAKPVSSRTHARDQVLHYRMIAQDLIII